MWPFDIGIRRRALQFSRDLDEWAAWERAAEDKGYGPWTSYPPKSGVWIEAIRREWATARVWQTGFENPEFNVANLWWRPWLGETIEGKIVDTYLEA